MTQPTPSRDEPTSKNEGSAVLGDTLQNLTQAINSFNTPAEVVAYFFGFKHSLESQNQKLRIDNQSLQQKCLRLESENADLRPRKPPAASFTCFSKLPVELRLRIWNFALPEARFVELAAEESDCNDEEEDFESLYSCPANHHPAVLHVCKEARDEALKRHPLCKEQPGGIPRFFNHTRDILYMKDYFWLEHQLQRTRAKKQMTKSFIERAGFSPSQLQRFATDSTLWVRYSELLIDFLADFPLLEEFTLLYHEIPNDRISWDNEPEVGQFEIVELGNKEYMYFDEYDGTPGHRILVSKWKGKVCRALTRKMENDPLFAEGRKVPQIQVLRRVRKRVGAHRFDLVLGDYD